MEVGDKNTWFTECLQKIKELMNEVYLKLGIDKKGKASDLEKLYGFRIHPCKIPLDNGDRKNGYRIIGI